MSKVVTADNEILEEAKKRRTFAIISHPDAGKTTLTEKLLLYGGAIHEAGSVRARKASHHAASDWMAIEKERYLGHFIRNAIRKKKALSIICWIHPVTKTFLKILFEHWLLLILG